MHDHAGGLDVAELTPSQYVSQNEIDAAKTVKLEYLNTQGQPKFVWPPSFSLAKAYVDQLERNKCLPASRIAAIRSFQEKPRALARAAARCNGAGHRGARNDSSPGNSSCSGRRSSAPSGTPTLRIIASVSR